MILSIIQGKEKMKMPKWNPMQLKAIQTKEKNVLVSASAGSGKTTVLIARLMDLVVKDRVPIDAILAMTFTEAAANEMKKRLAASLQEAYQTCTNDEDRAYITKQLTSVQQAHISTIHSFCLSILQEYYYIIGLDAQRISNIMDNGLMEQFQQKALQIAFQNQYQKNDEAFYILSSMFSARAENDDALSNMIRQLASIASSKPNPSAWLQEVSDRYKNKQRIEDLDLEIVESFYEFIQVHILRYQEVLLQLQELYRFRYDGEVKKKAVLDAKIALLPALQEPLSTRNYEEFRLQLRAISQGIVPASPDKEDTYYTRLRKQSQEIEDKLLSILFSEQQMIDDINTLAKPIEKLVEMTLDYRNTYQTMKEKHAVIDFDDMEHLALEILQANHGQVAEIYRNQFVEIMVDEFQDSNDVQNELVMLICRKNNVFRVGDIKQSIYGFRHAKPQLMRGLIDHAKEDDEVIYLSNNYRSKKMIVEFNNILFKRLMNIDGFQCSYAKEDDVETGVPAQNENNVPICFHAIYHDEIKKANDLILSKNDFKASYIANQILEMHNYQQRKWKDFVVLVRGNARKEDMKKVFDELNIPYFIDVKTGFYQSNAVQIILSTLKAITQPHHDISFIACITSPLFEHSMQDIAQIKLQKDKNESYYTYFLKHPTNAFLAFENLRKQSFQLSLIDMLHALYQQNDYYELHTTIQEKTNLDLLFEKAVQFEQQDAMGILGFLSQIDQIKDAQTAEAIPIGSEADVVRVMSIHQSKGLQFPVVFLWSTDKMTPIEFKELCIADADMGIALKCMQLPQRYVRTTIPRIAIEQKKDREELEEEMRILYVATTRAQQEMHIVDCVLSLDAYHRPLTMSSVYERGGYTSWILQAFLQDPCELFTTKEIHTYWQNIPITQQTTQQISKLRYTKKHQAMDLVTPTQVRKDDLPKLHLQQTKQKASYGTLVHKMIEHLQLSTTTQDLYDIAKQYNFPIHDKDIHSLKKLQQHPLYQKVLSMKHYHEYPFMMKDHQTIIHGYMDLFAYNDTHAIIIDFKTDQITNKEILKQRYHKQLDTYRHVVSTMYPNNNLEVYIYSLHLHEAILL